MTVEMHNNHLFGPRKKKNMFDFIVQTSNNLCLTVIIL